MKEIEFVNEDEMPPELSEACFKVQDAMMKLHRTHGSANEIGLLANAMAICAGSLFGQIHQQSGVPEEMDGQVAAALAHNIMMGMDVGRNGWRNQSAH